MKLLILGGTGFVGRACVTEAVSAGWDVTVSNRSGRSPCPEAAAVSCDRNDDDGLDALDGSEWDVVVDTWSWAPAAVRRTTTRLADRVGRYVYISSRSVYRDPVPAGATESHPVVDCSAEDEDFGDYSRAKAGSEQAVRAAFGDRALIVRPGLILGPHENIGRLPWWLNTIADGGRIPVPGPESLALQYIDARDLATWALMAAARGCSGDYDAVSVPGQASMGSLLDACVSTTGSDAELVWLDPAAVETAGVRPWLDFPIWLPPGPDHDMMHSSDVTKAHAAGLVCRPMAETVTDTWDWLNRLGRKAPQRPDRPAVGMSAARLASLLDR